MAGQDTSPTIAALRKLEASLQQHFCDHHPAGAADGIAGPASDQPSKDCLLILPSRWRRSARKAVMVVGPIVAVIALAIGALFWRLASGPIPLDLATPWITAAIGENFGQNRQVEIGGTQLERDADGHASLRIRDIVVRDADGTIVASAPKAEVGVSGAGLFTGRVRAERLSLVGAEMAVRIESDGDVTVFAGADKRPIATASVPDVQGSRPSPSLASAPDKPVILPPNSVLGSQPAIPVPGPPTATRGTTPDLMALLDWIDGLGASGLDGHDLGELGLKNGSLVVDDRRTGKRWTFENIDLSLNRTKGGGVGFTVGSDDPARPWRLKATLAPAPRGHRTLTVDAQKVSIKDVLLALRVGDGQFDSDVPITARLRADIGPDGVPQSLDGRIVADSGTITQYGGKQPIQFAIDRAEATMEWDAQRRALMIPFQIVSGGNRITLFAEVDPPSDAAAAVNGASNGSWMLRMTGGSVVLASAAPPPAEPLVFNRFQLRVRFDPDKHRATVEQGDIGNIDVGIALSGSVDFTDADPRLAIGLASNRMPLVTLKTLWPVFVNTPLRTWFMDHVIGGTVEHVVIATNAPWSTLQDGGPPVPDDGLSIEIVGNGASLIPVDGLPPIRDADVNVNVSGRTAAVTLGKSTLELASGRKLVVGSGSFEIANTYTPTPAAKVRFRVDGPVPAAAELLALPPLKDVSGTPLDPATSRGTLGAQVTLAMTINTEQPVTAYGMNVDFTNFAADRLFLNQKIEAAALRAVVNQQGYQLKGDVKINGVPAMVDFRKPRDGDIEVRMAATLDEPARARFGFNMPGVLTGPVPVKVTGRLSASGNDLDNRFAIDADLTQAKVDQLLPGWQKAPGKASRATFTLSNKPQSTRFDDLTIDGPGVQVKGALEVDSTGDVVSVNFPAFALSDNDKTTLKADRGPDGALRVVMRGDLYDGRAFVKSLLMGSAADKTPAKDIDLDIRIGTVAGFYGETLRGLELKLSRRNGAIRAFNLNGKLGRDAPLAGDLRGRAGGKQVLYIETSDAGSLFRFTDVYQRLYGGEMWVAMDPPTAGQTPQDGLLNIRDFTVRGEASLDRVASGAASPSRTGVEFSRMRVEFTKTPGMFTIRDGVVRGPVVGATIDGSLDYPNNEVHMRGTFVPLFGLNNMFGQIPLFGIFLGGSNEGLVGVTYEVVGSPSAPVLRVNPISAVAPGLLRKFFEFPTITPQSYADPSR